MGKDAYRVSALVEKGAVVAPATKARDTKAERAKRRKSFFEGVEADFDCDLDHLRDAFVSWQIFLRKRKRERNPFTRARLDFTPALETIYTKYSTPRHLYLHNLALPIVTIVYFLLTLYDTIDKLPHPSPVLIINRTLWWAVLVVFIVLTRFSRWKTRRRLHIFTLNFAFLMVSEETTMTTLIQGEEHIGCMASVLAGFACFLFVDSSFIVQTLTGFWCTFIQVIYLYARQPKGYPLPFAHAVMVSSLIAVSGGCLYLYMSIRLSRRLFLDQVLARLQEYQLEREKERLNGLLHVILPKSIATRLKAGEQTISDKFEEATVMFAEILDFEDVIAGSSTLLAVKKLNKLYARFDAVTERNHCLRIKIIGTTYMAISGVPTIRQQHIELACTTALAMMEEMKTYCAEQNVKLRLRIGLNCGPLVAGVIGVEKFCYDVWGDTVNTAARMCSHAEASMIQVTQAVVDAIGFAFEFDQLEETFFKGKGKMTTFNLKGKKVFERRVAPVPALDLARLIADPNQAAEELMDGARLVRPHLDNSKLLDVDAGLNAAALHAHDTANTNLLGLPPNKDGTHNQALEDSTEGFERSAVREGAEGSSAVPERKKTPGDDTRDVRTRTISRASSRASSSSDSSEDESGHLPRRRSSAHDPVKSSGSLPGQLMDGSHASDDSSDMSFAHNNAAGARAVAFTTLVTTKTFETSMSTARTDMSSESDASSLPNGSTSAQQGGLNRFRQNLIHSASIDPSTLDSSRQAYMNTSRGTHRAGNNVSLATSRMQRARNLAAAFGFDGVSALDKEEAEKQRYAVTTRCCFTQFVASDLEHTFDERSVKETMNLARIAFGWCLFVLLTGVIYDFLDFYTASYVRVVMPWSWSPVELANGVVFRGLPTLTVGTLIGVRLAAGVPVLTLLLLLTFTKRAARLIPYMSVFAIWWIQLVENACIYIAQPVAIIGESHRLIAVIGTTIFVMRGLNVRRQFLTSAICFPLLIVGVFMSDTSDVWVINMIMYTVPLFVTAAALRSRLQVTQRTYFIERTKVARRSKDIAKEQDKANQMLLNIFPKTIYERIKRGEREIVDNHKAAVVLFADVVGFTKLSMEYTPAEVVGTLNEIFSAFDGLMGKYNLEKIKTIGDCFVCSAGVSTFNTSPFTNMANCALDMVAIMDGLRSGRGQKIEMRWGIHTGDVISAVVGDKKFLYDIFGEAVQTANLMEASSVAGRVLVSEPVAQALSNGYVLKQYKVVQTTNGKALNTHFLMGRKQADHSNLLLEETADSAHSSTVARLSNSGSKPLSASAHQLGETDANSSIDGSSPALSAGTLSLDGSDVGLLS